MAAWLGPRNRGGGQASKHARWHAAGAAPFGRRQRHRQRHRHVGDRPQAAQVRPIAGPAATCLVGHSQRGASLHGHTLCAEWWPFGHPRRMRGDQGLRSLSAQPELTSCRPRRKSVAVHRCRDGRYASQRADLNLMVPTPPPSGPPFVDPQVGPDKKNGPGGPSLLDGWRSRSLSTPAWLLAFDGAHTIFRQAFRHQARRRQPAAPSASCRWVSEASPAPTMAVQGRSAAGICPPPPGGRLTGAGCRCIGPRGGLCMLALQDLAPCLAPLQRPAAAPRSPPPAVWPSVRCPFSNDYACMQCRRLDRRCGTVQRPKGKPRPRRPAPGNPGAGAGHGLSLGIRS